MRDLYILFFQSALSISIIKNILIYLYSRPWFFSSVRWFYATFNALFKKIKLRIFFQGALLQWIPSLSFPKWSLKPLCEALCPANFVSMVTIINVGESTDVKNFSPTMSPHRLQQKQDVVDAALIVFTFWFNTMNVSFLVRYLY